MAQNVLITGGATRIGRVISIALGKAGWDVVVHHHRSKRDAEEVVSTLQDLGVRTFAVAADFSDPHQTANLISDAKSRLGPIDCLINNAALFEYDNINTLSRESWDTHFNINLTAPLLLSQKFAEQVSANGEGNIINIIDQRVWNPTPHFISYTLSKTGLWTLTQTLALALAPKVRVNGIGPGPTLPSARQTKEDFELQWQTLPLKRRVMPQDISDAVLYILSAKSMTGQMIALDSGQHLSWYPSPPDAVGKE